MNIGNSYPIGTVFRWINQDTILEPYRSQYGKIINYDGNDIVVVVLTGKCVGQTLFSKPSNWEESLNKELINRNGANKAV